MQTIVAALELELSNQTGVSLHRIAILTSTSIQQEDVSSKPFFLTKMAYKKNFIGWFLWKYCDRQYLTNGHLRALGDWMQTFTLWSFSSWSGLCIMEVERLRWFVQFPDSDNASADNQALAHDMETIPAWLMLPLHCHFSPLSVHRSPYQLIMQTQQHVNYFRESLRHCCRVSSS